MTTANPWVQIETLDPGWSATISLTGTAKQKADFEDVEINRSETDWIHCWVDGEADSQYLEWQGRGGSVNLNEMIRTFRSWVEMYDGG